MIRPSGNAVRLVVLPRHGVCARARACARLRRLCPLGPVSVLPPLLPCLRRGHVALGLGLGRRERRLHRRSHPAPHISFSPGRVWAPARRSPPRLCPPSRLVHIALLSPRPHQRIQRRVPPPLPCRPTSPRSKRALGRPRAAGRVHLCRQGPSPFRPRYRP